MNKTMLAEMDAAFQQEIARVSTLEYNSNSICRTFYENLRQRLADSGETAPVQREEADTAKPTPEQARNLVK